MAVAIAIPQTEWHIYIDGQSLRGEVDSLLKRFFDSRIDQFVFFPRIDQPHGSLGKRYFYDALPIQKLNEGAEDFSARFDKRKEEFSRIARQPNTHVCTGMTRQRSGRGRREAAFEQKGVDVLLTVDALRAAYGGVTKNMLFVTGDIDFIPLFDHLISLGINVHLLHPKRVSDDLIEAVDAAQCLTSGHLFRCLGMTGTLPNDLSSRLPNWVEQSPPDEVELTWGCDGELQFGVWVGEDEGRCLGQLVPSTGRFWKGTCARALLETARDAGVCIPVEVERWRDNLI